MAKILVAGNWRAYIHEESISHAFETLGCEVIRFKWNNYFISKNLIYNLYSKIEYRLSFGFIVSRINTDLVNIAIKNKPDLLFIYRPILISAKTLKKIKTKSPGTIVVSYNNDNPFGSHYSWYYWRRYIKSISSYDLIYSYRPSNIQQYKALGAKRVKLLQPWFIKHLTFPINLDQNELIKYKSDVVFIAHYENDGRVEIIKSLLEAGIDISLYGPEWNKVIVKDDLLQKYYPVKYLSGDEYSKVLCGSKIALALYSSLNNDVYTRKCFEIPATATMMIAKRSKEMLELFNENEECVFFNDTKELIEKIRFYLKENELRQEIANNGYNRVINSGYDVFGRASYILDSYKTP